MEPNRKRGTFSGAERRSNSMSFKIRIGRRDSNDTIIISILLIDIIFEIEG